MDFDYFDLLTLKASLEFTQKSNRDLNLSCLIKKITSLIEKVEG